MGRAGANIFQHQQELLSLQQRYCLSLKVNLMELRVPIPVGSISDLTFVTERPVTVEEINAILKKRLRRKIQ
jgi:hypothetical protein